jgi:hypothetical protein
LIHVSCRNCNAYDVVGPGHPATTFDPATQQHVITDRSALRHSHADDCEPHPETGHYPLTFEFMAGHAPVDMTGGN